VDLGSLGNPSSISVLPALSRQLLPLQRLPTDFNTAVCIDLYRWATAAVTDCLSTAVCNDLCRWAMMGALPALLAVKRGPHEQRDRQAHAAVRASWCLHVLTVDLTSDLRC
jgi:hypothetical protein